MGSGVSRVMAGSFIGTGALLNVDTVGFRPKMVQLFNATGLTQAVWTKTMADDSAFKQINHGTVQNAFITSDGIIPRANGFSVGTDADLNTAAEVVHWVAHE
jgi:hypothetical protein